VDDALSPQAFQRLRSHPDFRTVVEDHCRASLDHHAGMPLVDRWLVSDLGRQSLSRAMVILDAVYGEVGTRALVEAAQANRTCSRGRVLAFLKRAELNGMISAPPAQSEMDRVFKLESRFIEVMGRYTEMMVETVARLSPEAAPAAEAITEPDFRRRFMATLGRLSVSRRDLFAGPEMPVVLFLYRDGGERILERLIISQPRERSRLLQWAPVSRSSLARTAFTSRQHVRRLLDAGESEGFLSVSPRSVAFSAALSDDVERHFSLIFEIARAAALITQRRPEPGGGAEDRPTPLGAA